MKGHLFRAFAFVAALALAGFALAAPSSWTFSGCWAQFSAGTCYDVYRDSSGAYWRCAPCRTTKNPSPRNCFQINPSTGLWCS